MVRPLRLASIAILLLLPSAGLSQSDSTLVELSAPLDSTRAAVDSTRLGPDWSWARWPAIDAAIRLQPLDGPRDILEKEEIIADRLDALAREQTRLDSIAAGWDQRRVALSAQQEVLEDLADLQLGGDLDLQRRIEAVHDDSRQADEQYVRLATISEALQRELARLQTLSHDYRDAAARLRDEEEGLR